MPQSPELRAPGNGASGPDVPGNVRLVATVLLTLALLLSACGRDAEPAAVTPGSDRTPSPSRTGQLPEPVLPSPEPSPEPSSLVTGEVPTQLLDDVLDQASARTGVAVADIGVVRAEQVVWNDGSLGCPEPGRAYTQALVPGYWVVLDAGGTELDYRANDRGYVVLCEQPTRTRPSPATDS